MDVRLKLTEEQQEGLSKALKRNCTLTELIKHIDTPEVACRLVEVRALERQADAAARQADAMDRFVTLLEGSTCHSSW